MTDFVTTAWHVDIVFLLGFVAVVAGYATATRRLHRFDSGQVRQHLYWFMAGLALLLVAVTSPLDALASEYLLSAHMVQHLLLSQIIPPLLLLGLPAAWVVRALSHPGVAAVERELRRPLVAWSAGILVLWLWHVPAMFDLAVANHTIGHLHHLTVLAAGLLFWWPVLSPVHASRMEALPSAAYLVAACLASTVLGMTLTFAPEAVYSAYRQPVDSFGVLAELRGAGLTPRADQQIAGLIMWMPCCVLYLIGIGGVLVRWYGAGEVSALTPGPSPADAGEGSLIGTELPVSPAGNSVSIANVGHRG
jgi:cytochrome c oxidase assembly factor CtaG